MTEKSSSLTAVERQQLLTIAREAITAAAEGRTPPQLDVQQFSQNLRELGASFVTLTSSGCLRGCIGALEVSQPLVLDVQEHAIAAAAQDCRFEPLKPQEAPFIRIEISRLTLLQPLEYQTAEDLPDRLRPGVDGVVINNGIRRATFLPKVWKKLPSTQDFLSHLCMKMGDAPDLWMRRKLEINVYQVEEFGEE